MACQQSESFAERTPPCPPLGRGGKEMGQSSSFSPPYEGGGRGGVFASPWGVRYSIVKRSRTSGPSVPVGGLFRPTNARALPSPAVPAVRRGDDSRGRLWRADVFGERLYTALAVVRGF